MVDSQILGAKGTRGVWAPGLEAGGRGNTLDLSREMHGWKDELVNEVDIASVFPGWQLGRLLGSGSYGVVYKIFQAPDGEGGVALESALKILSIPREQKEIDDLANMSMSEQSIYKYFDDAKQSVMREVNAMAMLKGSNGIVSIEDRQPVRRKDGPGWLIFIKMELLESLSDYKQSFGGLLPASESVHVGIDIATALEACHSKRIIHRDIKPENIFRTKSGDFKLGDFGISRRIMESTNATPGMGSPAYMAPEVESGNYSESVDIFSLGMVLYRLLNGNRAPFYPPSPQPITHSNTVEAETRRLRGDRLPNPINADEYLGDVLRVACNNNPNYRFQNAAAFRRALEGWDGYARK